MKLYQRSRDDAIVKSFVLRLVNKADFNKVIKVLPWQTGARWYERQVRDPAQRAAPYFNKVHRSDAYFLDSAGSVLVTPDLRSLVTPGPVSNLRPGLSDLYFTPTGRGTAAGASPLIEMDTSLLPPASTSTSVSSAIGSFLSVTRMITPLTVTSSISTPKLSIGGPMSNVGESSSTIVAVNTE